MGSPLTVADRLYVYALHGFLIEVLFSATWDFVLMQKWTLAGCSNIWSLPIYGISGLVMEVLADKMLSRGLVWPWRGLVYLVWIYCWEYSSGFVLRSLNACPWDYSAFDYNINGLITLEYGPLWMAASLLMEKVVIQRLSHLRWHPKPAVKSFKLN
ncbi:transmembrane protein 229b-like [Neocloeon triangulifer]|uniref:transmembrane protein 229b-like n=1 Tax=Neocloeon triangulifer TaxID=2078957 RepID=UPI00286EDE20|nr:transmembrane protein 229b-like [Neocloeon triangulifer]